MKWPKVNVKETFEEMERRSGITTEINDVRRQSLGAHPSASFYSQGEQNINLAKMRAHFDSIADRY